MVRVIYHDNEGKTHEVDARSGDSLMEIAVTNGVPGIDAICGGSCVCGTCHVYVDEAYFDRLPPKSTTEVEILENSENTRPNSRLSCQIRAGDALEGIEVRIPAEQV